MKLFFRKVGEGKPLIILHGLFGMSDNWNTLAKQFSEKDFSVYLPDARNHGRSPHSDEFNYKVMSEDLLHLMNDEKISSTSVVGHSMGGKTAMFFAMQNPERIRKLMVADISPRSYPDSNEDVVAALQSIDLNSVSARKEAEEKLRVALRGDETTTQFLLKSLFWQEEKLAWRFNVEGIGKNLGKMSEETFGEKQFSGETLFLRGEKSNYITKEDEPLIKKYFPNALIETVLDARHWIHADNPKGFMEATLKFLEK